MSLKALIIDNVAVNVCDAAALTDSFHPDIADRFVGVPDGVVVGSRLVSGEWVAPQPDVHAAPAPTSDRIGIIQFKMRFTPAELIDIRASADEVVKLFLAEFVDDPRTGEVELLSPFVQEAIGYLAGLSNPPLEPALLQPARIPEILAPAAV